MLTCYLYTKEEHIPEVYVLVLGILKEYLNKPVFYLQLYFMQMQRSLLLCCAVKYNHRFLIHKSYVALAIFICNFRHQQKTECKQSLLRNKSGRLFYSCNISFYNQKFLFTIKCAFGNVLLLCFPTLLCRSIYYPVRSHVLISTVDWNQILSSVLRRFTGRNFNTFRVAVQPNNYRSSN